MIINIIAIILTILILGIVVFLNHPLFGKKPSGERLLRIQKSPNYKNKQFRNLSFTPQLTEGYTMSKVLWNFLFNKNKNLIPRTSIPIEKIDFKTIDYSKNQYFWLGHSSYLLIIEGKTFLIDPVLTRNAAPIIRANKAFAGTTFVNLEELPMIDFLIITHDHYDHLDYTTIKKIKNKVKNVVCGLGVGSHFEHWKYSEKNIFELDWWQAVDFGNNVEFTATPARHFSGRSFLHKNNTLFCSFVLKTKSKNIYIGGDSGYDSHFKEIGNKFGPFDFAFIENGQYNNAWKYIHLMPENMKDVFNDIQSKIIVPVHHSKFALSTHSWKEPLEKVVLNKNEQTIIQMPKIGACVSLDNPQKDWEEWWINVN